GQYRMVVFCVMYSSHSKSSSTYPGRFLVADSGGPLRQQQVQGKCVPVQKTYVAQSFFRGCRSWGKQAQKVQACARVFLRMLRLGDHDEPDGYTRCIRTADQRMSRRDRKPPRLGVAG